LPKKQMTEWMKLTCFTMARFTGGGGG
jgi:hypothetical protein